MAFRVGLSYPCLASSHRVSDSTTRLSLRNLNSNSDRSVTLCCPVSKTGMRRRSLLLFAVLDENNEYDDNSEFDAKKVYEMLQTLTGRVKKAAMVVQVEAIRTQKQLFDEEHVGYSEGELVKATVNGVQAPVRVEIADAALKLGAQKLSLLVHEAYIEAHKKTVQSMKNKMSSISVDLGVQDEDLRDEMFRI